MLTVVHIHHSQEDELRLSYDDFTALYYDDINGWIKDNYPNLYGTVFDFENTLLYDFILAFKEKSNNFKVNIQQPSSTICVVPIVNIGDFTGKTSISSTLAGKLQLRDSVGIVTISQLK